MSTESKEQIAKRKHLSPKEKAFVEFYTRVGDTYGLPKESALAAGFSESQAEATGSRFLKTAMIQKAINDVHQKFLDDFAATPARTMADIEQGKAMALKKKDSNLYKFYVDMQGKALCMWKEGIVEDVEQNAERIARMTEEEKVTASIATGIRTIQLANGCTTEEAIRQIESAVRNITGLPA